MEIALSEEQALLRDAIREVATKEVTFESLRDHERSGTMDTGLWDHLARLGWLGLPFDRDDQAESLLRLAIVVEELARVAAVVPYAEVMAAGVILMRYAADGFADAEIERIAEGRSIVVPAVFNESDSLQSTGDAGMASDATFTGSRLFVDFGHFASSFLVRRTIEGEPNLALVANDGASVKVSPLSTISRTPVSRVDFENTPVQPIAGAEADQFLRQLMQLLSAVQCLACSEVAAEMATEYVKQRVQFGRPLGTFQAVQHHCANMATLNRAARFLLYEAVWALENNSLTPGQIAVAKAWTAKSAVEVTALAHQLHGGIGVTEEFDLHFYSRRAKYHSIAWGTADECLDEVAATVDEPIDWS